MKDIFAFGLGLASKNKHGKYLDTYFPLPLLAPNTDLCQILNAHFEAGTQALHRESLTKLAEQCAGLEDEQSQQQTLIFKRFLADRGDQPKVAVKLMEDTAIASTPEAYLKLHLLSHRLCLPNSLNLEGLFQKLPTVCWTSQGPIDPEEVSEALLSARLAGKHLDIHSLDKFPRMSNYVIPTGVRIADSSRVRLGAYLGDGTTVMHAGFVNFNAGALGPNMIEGRVSQGVTVGAHSDLGGSSSTMGTLSGGGKITLSLGEHCLIGANSGTGIPLGDRCTIEAGLYITAGTQVEYFDTRDSSSKLVKARDLAHANDLLFIRHSQTGKVICRFNPVAAELNESLHKNN